MQPAGPPRSFALAASALAAAAAAPLASGALLACASSPAPTAAAADAVPVMADEEILTFRSRTGALGDAPFRTQAHGGLLARTWADEIARAGLESPLPFRVGATFVQEVFDPAPGGGGGTARGLYLMQKRVPGSEPGSWYYARIGPDGVIQEDGFGDERALACERCHAASDHDRVYGPPRR